MPGHPGQQSRALADALVYRYLVRPHQSRPFLEGVTLLSPSSKLLKTVLSSSRDFGSLFSKVATVIGEEVHVLHVLPRVPYAPPRMVAFLTTRLAFSELASRPSQVMKTEETGTTRERVSFLDRKIFMHRIRRPSLPKQEVSLANELG